MSGPRTTESRTTEGLLPPGATVLGVWAHPDDEAYLSAGLMLRTVRTGGRVVCLHATLGELGTEDTSSWPPERLAPRRREELTAALGTLGVREHQLLTYPDGGLEQVSDDEVVPVIVELLRQLRPDVVVTFGPDGITGHPDHRTVSRWVTSAWREASHGQLLYAVVTREFMERFAELHRRLGLENSYAGVVDNEQVALEVVLDEEELTLKRAALAAHATQTEALAEAMGETTYRRWFAVETFRVPRPDSLEDYDPPLRTP